MPANQRKKLKAIAAQHEADRKTQEVQQTADSQKDDQQKKSG